MVRKPLRQLSLAEWHTVLGTNLTGSVKNAGQREEAGKLAEKVPNVHQVVNQLEVHP